MTKHQRGRYRQIMTTQVQIGKHERKFEINENMIT